MKTRTIKINSAAEIEEKIAFINYTDNANIDIIIDNKTLNLRVYVTDGVNGYEPEAERRFTLETLDTTEYAEIYDAIFAYFTVARMRKIEKQPKTVENSVETVENKIKDILAEAKKCKVKGNYVYYTIYANKIRDTGADWKTVQQAIVKLVKIMKV